MSPHPPATITQRAAHWQGALLAVPAALLVTTLAECLRIPPDVYWDTPSRLVTLPLLALSAAVTVLWPAVLCQLLLSAALSSPWLASAPFLQAKRIVTTLALAAPSALTAFWPLRSDRVLAKYPFLVAFYLGVFACIALAYLLALRAGSTNARWWDRARARGWFAGLALLASGAVHFGNLTRYVDDYYALHASALCASYLLLHIGLMPVTGLLQHPLLPRVSVHAALAGVAAALVLVLPLRSWPAFAQSARPYLLGHTALGQSLTVYGLSLPSPVLPRAVRVRRAGRYFAAHSAMPPLPDAFDLSRYNVLLVMSEAVRFDQTSLGAPALETTPNLLRLQQDAHTVSFLRAYSPSSCTAQSVASTFTMRAPGAVHFEVWRRRWYGQLMLDNHTVPELFNESGYRTFRIGHNYLRLFGEGMLGVDQGFDSVRLIESQRDSVDTDRTIARATAKRLRMARRSGKRFFGWVFFVSPHSHYVAHDPERPATTELERYRQELRYMDTQLGVVLDTLDNTGLADDTIVIFMGDHGEQFGEHGGTDHSRNVYTESVHVPLLARIPGMTRAQVHEPVSAAYVFPWLLLGGNEPQQRAAREALAADIVPLMQATGDAVVVELLGADRVRSALVYPERKFNYDSMTGLHEAYEVSRDPLEQRNLFESDRRVAAHARQAVTDYRAVRAATQRYKVDAHRSRSTRNLQAEPR